MTSAGRGGVEGSRARWLALAVAVLVVLASCAYQLPLVGLHADDGQYVVGAKALASGDGYRQLQAPGAPPQTKYPVLFPLLLAALWRAWPDFPANTTLLSTAGSVSLGIAAAAWFAWARRRGVAPGPAAAWTLAGFTLPALAGLCAQVMSEGPFLALLVAGFLWMEDPDPDRPAPVAAGLAFGLAGATRSIGIAVVVSAVAWALWQRRARAGFVVAAFAPPALWFAWSLASHDPSAAGAAAYGTSYERWLASVPPGAWPTILGHNVLALFVHTGHLMAQAAIATLPAAARPLTALLCGTAVVIATVAAARRLGGVVAWVLAGYVGLAIVWPWPPSRFLVVILPVALLPVASAWRGRGGRALAAVAALVAAGGLAHAAFAARLAVVEPGLRTAGPPPVAWGEYEALFAWIRRETPQDAVVASVAEPMVYLYADRRGVFPYAQDTVAINYTNPPTIGDADDLDRMLRVSRASYLVRMPAPAWAHAEMLDGVIARLRAEQPWRLRSAYVGRDRRFEVFRVEGASR